MAVRITITVDEQALEFLDQVAQGNRSAYVNRLLNDERERYLAEMILQANLEEAADEAYQAELAEWDVTLGDGIA